MDQIEKLVQVVRNATCKTIGAKPKYGGEDYDSKAFESRPGGICSQETPHVQSVRKRLAAHVLTLVKMLPNAMFCLFFVERFGTEYVTAHVQLL